MVDERADLDRRITDALAALRCARAVVEHSANTTTLGLVDLAERRLDGLLDQLPRAEPKQRPMALAATVPGPRTPP
jgi:hypothetical protein